MAVILVGFNVKQKRSFHTVLSGLKFSRFGNRTVRFLTLSTSLICSEAIGYGRGSLNVDFQKLRKRVCRYSPYRLYKEGYITKRSMVKNYGRNNSFKKFGFEYFKVETSEGNGVLHILYRGSYLPYNFLVDNWSDIHNSWEINICKVNMEDIRNASLYVVSQYVGNQESAYVRSSQSWNWVFRGFKTRWYDLKYQYNHWNWDISIYDMYDNILKRKAESYFYPQSFLEFG